jgi:hypothetical protein
MLQWRATGCKDTDPWHPPNLLGFSERRGEEAERYTGDERSPIHYSIT